MIRNSVSAGVINLVGQRRRLFLFGIMFGALFATVSCYDFGNPVSDRSSLLGGYAGNVSYGFDSLTLLEDSTYIHKAKGKYSTIYTDTGYWTLHVNEAGTISFVYMRDYISRHPEMIDIIRVGRLGRAEHIFCNALEKPTHVTLWVSEDKVILYTKQITLDSPD
ncbi:hypothetical protein JYU19_00125 [bacterium AH-315-J21]|nr:hypothetical protein [bacterium AH-315-J21]